MGFFLCYLGPVGSMVAVGRGVALWRGGESLCVVRVMGLGFGSCGWMGSHSIDSQQGRRANTAEIWD